MYNDLRFAFRMILTHRLFSIAVIVTMALGIGVNTTVFTLVNAVLYKPLPIPDGDRLVVVRGHNLNHADSQFGVSFPDFRDYRDLSQSFDMLEAVRFNSATLSEQANPPEQFSGAQVTTGLFDMLGTAPLFGRGFTLEDGAPDAEKVVLISHDVWQNRYAGDRAVIGRSVRYNGHPATIIGVMPEVFEFPSNQKVWSPLVLSSETEDRKQRPLEVYGILKEGMSKQSAGADLATIAHRIAGDYPDENKDISVIVQTFHERYNGGTIKNVFLVMLGAVGFVLLIACANVANMLLSRSVARRHEISVRTSLGAVRWQLIRQLLIEAVTLSTLGGILGLGIAMFGVHAFDLATQNVGKPYWILFEMDFQVFAYFSGICILSGIVFGLTPALRATRIDIANTLKDSGRGATGSKGGKLTAVLVVLQFALTVVLLSGAGLMVRSYFESQAINSFIPADKFFTVRLRLPQGEGDRYENPQSRLEFYDSLLGEVKAMPGVINAAAVSNPPGLGVSDRRYEIEGQPQPVISEAPRLAMLVQTTDYLPTIGLPILRGEYFDDFISKETPLVSIVTNEFAQHHWPGESGIGKRFRVFEDDEPKPWVTVIGVCADLDQDPGESDFRPLVFLPHRQRIWSGMALMVRTSGDASELAQPVRRIVQDLDQDLPLFDARTLQESLKDQFWFLKVFGTLFISFALIGLVIAAVGIYGVVAQTTALRTQEIGIRMALGASSFRVVRLVLFRGLVQLGIGLMLGLLGASAANGLMGELTLASVSSQDPVVFISISVIVVIIGVLACWVPANKAAHLEPSSALRAD